MSREAFAWVVCATLMAICTIGPAWIIAVITTP